jgi:hypothetical protein
MFSRRSILLLGGFALAAPRISWTEDRPVPTDIDHILLGLSDLEYGIAWVEQRTGIRAKFGGVHPGRGTRNALLSLGPRRYLEIIAPDPQQQLLPPAQSLAAMREPRLFNWAVHTNDVAAADKRAVAAGIETEGLAAGSRTRPDGKILRWQTCRLKDDRGGLLPFFIQWDRESVHPAEDAPVGCILERFAVETPAVREFEGLYGGLGVQVSVAYSEKPALRAMIRSPKGKLELGS